ncbi:MAG: aldo/keto reductase, partial [Bacteroidales bacterium]|nr:aldo/keto reductase [Bacteroidales bacterium]
MKKGNNLTGIFHQKCSRRTTLKAIAAGTVSLTLGITGACKRSPEAQEAMEALSMEEGEIIPITTRKNPKNGDKISLLGFGSMRLPSIEEGADAHSGGIDEELTEKMVDYAYRHGVNYFDTAWIYAGGNSEIVMGKILKKYPRESFFLADKMPLTFVPDKSLAVAKEIFETQLKKCQVDYFDYYLMHAINTQEQYENDYLHSGVLEYLKEQKKLGRIRNLGFSFHGPVDVMKYMLSQPESWD